MVVYLDTVLFYNVLADDLLLLAAGRLAGLPLRRRRIFAAALLGGIYAAAAALPAEGLLHAWWLKLLVAALMVLTAFGRGGYFLRRYLLFLLVSGGFAGVELALCGFAGVESGMPPFGLPLFLGSFALCWLLLGVVFRGSGGPAVRGLLLPVSVSHRGRCAAFTALADSGCTLRDPVSGDEVLVAELSVLEGLFSREEQETLKRRQAPPGLPMVQLPFQSLGGGGELAAFRAEEVTVGGTVHKNALVAIHPEQLGGETFHALWGGEESGK